MANEKEPELDEARLQAVLEDLVFQHPHVTAICKPGINLRPEGGDLVAFMLDEGGESHDLGSFPVSWISRRG